MSILNMAFLTMANVDGRSCSCTVGMWVLKALPHHNSEVYEALLEARVKGFWARNVQYTLGLGGS